MVLQKDIILGGEMKSPSLLPSVFPYVPEFRCLYVVPVYDLMMIGNSDEKGLHRPQAIYSRIPLGLVVGFADEVTRDLYLLIIFLATVLNVFRAS